MACLEKRPDRRPKSAGALADKLAACVAAASWSCGAAKKWWETYLRDRPRKRSGVDPAAETGSAGTLTVDLFPRVIESSTGLINRVEEN